MKKNELVFTIVIGVLLTYFSIVLFLPLFDGNSCFFGYNLFKNIRFIFIYILPIISCILTSLTYKKKDLRLISFLLFNSIGIFSLTSLQVLGQPTVWFILHIIFCFLSGIIVAVSLNIEKSFKIIDIVEGALFVAFAIGLDLPALKIRIGANGGSISLTMIPLMIYSYRRGAIKGFIASGIVYGMITCLTDGWGVQYFPFDYLLGYGSMGIVGYAKYFQSEKKFKNVLFGSLFTFLAVISRLLMSTISGTVFYEMDFISSLGYNATYIIPSGCFAIVLMGILINPILKITKKSKIGL